MRFYDTFLISISIIFAFTIIKEHENTCKEGDGEEDEVEVDEMREDQVELDEVFYIYNSQIRHNFSVFPLLRNSLLTRTSSKVWIKKRLRRSRGGSVV